jgi:hypothetical protein
MTSYGVRALSQAISATFVCCSKVSVRLVMRPTGSTNALIPLFVERTRKRRCSTARKRAIARWIQGAVVSPNQASFVMFTSRSGELLRIKRFTKLGMMSS